MGNAVEPRIYEPRESVVFCKTNEAFGGLSNMAPGFPLRVNGIDILTSEALYQACRFPHLPDVQRLIIDQKSPMTAKMKSKPYRSRSREDWEVVRVRIMRWCLRVKLALNWTKLRDLLLATGDRPIVEESRKDDFWGAKVGSDGVLGGANVLGRLLMELREELRGASCDSFRAVDPPAVRDFMLYGDPIRVVEAADGGAGAEDFFTTMAANRPEKQAGDRARHSAPVVSTVGSSGMETRTRTGSDAAYGVSAKAYPRRLIEVDLPIKEISAHARREKSIRHGHISTLHIWWARRPLAACRAVILAALWPDPADPLCPERFRVEAAKAMEEFRDRRGGKPRNWEDPVEIRAALLDFIAEFANWDNSAVIDFLEPARRLVQAAHTSLGSRLGTRPLVVDPFAGGGAIPLEALRIGAEPFASDLNPIPVMLNRVLLDYGARYGTRLSGDVRRLGLWLQQQAEEELSAFYPSAGRSSRPIAYLWGRTIQCEGPGCGLTIPLVRSPFFCKKKSKLAGLRLSVDAKTRAIEHSIVAGGRAGDYGPITCKGGAVTCPGCGFTTGVQSVRTQLARRRGGAVDARLLAVVFEDDAKAGRQYRAPSDQDLQAIEGAKKCLATSIDSGSIPNEKLNHLRGFFNVVLYGMERWGDLFSPRQQVALATFWRLLRDELPSQLDGDASAPYTRALQTTLACVVARVTNGWSSVCRWNSAGEKIEGTFARQALPMVWDFAEANPFSTSTGSFLGAVDWVSKVCSHLGEADLGTGQAVRASATDHPLPNDSADLLFTDPPYYDAVPYADLSDYFYVWHRRALSGIHPDLFEQPLTPKDEECVTLAHRAAMYRNKDRSFFEDRMLEAMSSARRVVRPSGAGVVVFANKSTSGWEAMLSALVDAGWTITGSWPIDTEMVSRLRAHGSAVLSSSVHLVCRPRENPDGSLRTDDIGDWRSVLRELPARIHDWMPRLAKEGVVGADAIFACLGPALEIFSRYSRVEKASGERVELREYLEQVWAAVAREALSMIFEDADATGLEEDARLTAMWLWTLSTSANGGGNGPDSTSNDEEDVSTSEDGEEGSTGKSKPNPGFSLEFDAARKIAQGLGAHLEDLGRVVEIKGDQARLLSVAERTRHLFGKDQAQRAPARRAKKVKQLTLFEELEVAEKDASWGDVGLPPLGETTLDRVHQAMVLFAAGRGEALKRYLVEEGVGRATTFWKLAQSLSALYPNGTDEKRWVDGVLARKKGLGFG